MNKKNEVIAELARCFARINNKLGRLEKKPVEFSAGEKFFAAELHTIQAIGQNRAKTVTALCNEFGITKGGASQIVTKLEKKKCVEKQRNMDNPKEVQLSLTKKGWTIFHCHMELHEKKDKELFGFLKAVPQNQLTGFLDILAHIEEYVDGFLRK